MNESMNESINEWMNERKKERGAVIDVTLRKERIER
jgi:hypothetical protein